MCALQDEQRHWHGGGWMGVVCATVEASCDVLQAAQCVEITSCIDVQSILTINQSSPAEAHSQHHILHASHLARLLLAVAVAWQPLHCSQLGLWILLKQVMSHQL